MNGMQERGRALKQYSCVNEWFSRFAGSLKINITLFNISFILGLNKTFLWLCKVLVWVHMKNTSTFQISQSCESNAQTLGKLVQTNFRKWMSKIQKPRLFEIWKDMTEGLSLGLEWWGSLVSFVREQQASQFKICEIDEDFKIIVSACLPDINIFLQLLWPWCSCSQNLLPLLNQIMKSF